MKYTILLFIFLWISCKSPKDKAMEQDILLQRDSGRVFAQIDSLVDIDQALRISDFDITDTSISPVKSDSVCNIQEMDSLLMQRELLSKAVTQWIIGIIKQYGYPSRERFLKKAKGPMTSILIQHADTSYRGELIPLLENEHKLGRINKNTFEFAKWHLNGRVGIPDLTGIKIIVHSKKGDSVILNN